MRDGASHPMGQIRYIPFLLTVGDNGLTNTATGGGRLNYFTLDASEPALRKSFPTSAAKRGVN